MRRTGSLLTLALLLASAAPAADTEAPILENPRLKAEAELYRQYCSACHGVSGRGDGIVAPFLDPRPIDLTLIKQNFEGRFPKYLVTMSVEGRDTVRAHGKSDMPVWGEVFAAELLPDDPDRQARARGKVMKIVDYVESIQR